MKTLGEERVHLLVVNMYDGKITYKSNLMLVSHGILVSITMRTCEDYNTHFSMK
jgi:hypothetical protein